MRARAIKANQRRFLAITYSLSVTVKEHFFTMFEMESSESTASSSPGYKTEDRNHAACCTARTSFMISDILDPSRRSRSPRQRCRDEFSSEPEEDTTSLDGDRDHASETESAVDGEIEREQSKLHDGATPNEDCCGGSPKSSSAGSPGEFSNIHALFCMSTLRWVLFNLEMNCKS